MNILFEVKVGMANFIMKIKNSEFGMRIQEKFYPTKRYDPDHRAIIQTAVERYNRCTCKKNTSQIRKEIQVCKYFWKCYPYHYFMNDLYRNDIEISDEELKNYIPPFFWYRLFLPHYRSRKFMLLSTNKIITDQLFGNLKIPKPETLYYLINGDLYSSVMKKISKDMIEGEFAGQSAEKLFFKPVDGSGGKGITVFHKTDSDRYKTKQGLFFDRKFLASLGRQGDYIIEAGLRQDKEVSAIFSGAINTFRIFTENKNGNTRAVCAMLRIGRNLAEVDNAFSGGICTNINIASGEPGYFAVNYDCEKFQEHPNTRFVFRNFKNSRWQEIVNFATESAEKIPFFTYLGWDIALTPEGPIAIEFNWNSALDIVEMTGGGLREAFGIDDPHYYWKNPGKRI
jgi:hypothetical protein